jgi:dipeptidase E
MKCHLIGGGPGALTATRRHIKAALAELKTDKPLVAYVGAASDDNAGFQKMLSGLFLGTGAKVVGVKLASARAKVASAQQLLADCDLVFMSGGDVDHGMNVLKQRGVVDDLRQLAKQGKPFIGISAGSIMLARHWVRFPDDDDSKAEPFDCLGIAPVHMDAHSEDDGWSELRTLIRLLVRKEERALGYGVPSKGCLALTIDGAEVAMHALGDSIARIECKKGNGAAVEREPLKPE